jgi:hypothetical protein
MLEAIPATGPLNKDHFKEEERKIGVGSQMVA